MSQIMESEIGDLSFAVCASERLLSVYVSQSSFVAGEDVFASRGIVTQRP